MASVISDRRASGQRRPPDRIGHVVVGLGRTGVSCVRHLRARGLAVHAMDSRAEPPGLARLGDVPGVALTLGRFDERILGRAERIVPDPDDSHVWLITRLGTYREFWRPVGGVYQETSPSDEYRTLTRTASGWELRELDGTFHSFGTDGRWTGTADANGNARLPTYDAAGILTSPTSCLDPAEVAAQDCNTNGIPDDCDVDDTLPRENMLDVGGCFANCLPAPGPMCQTDCLSRRPSSSAKWTRIWIRAGR